MTSCFYLLLSLGSLFLYTLKPYTVVLVTHFWSYKLFFYDAFDRYFFSYSNPGKKYGIWYLFLFDLFNLKIYNFRFDISIKNPFVYSLIEVVYPVSKKFILYVSKTFWKFFYYCENLYTSVKTFFFRYLFIFLFQVWSFFMNIVDCCFWIVCLV